MESNLGVFGFTRKVRVSTASFCDMSVFLTAQEKPRPPRRTSKLSRAQYALRIPRIFSRQNPEYPQIAPHAGKKNYVGGIETLGSLSLYLWLHHTKRKPRGGTESRAYRCIPRHVNPLDMSTLVINFIQLQSGCDRKVYLRQCQNVHVVSICRWILCANEKDVTEMLAYIVQMCCGIKI